jgi:uncharacterized membrane protein
MMIMSIRAVGLGLAAVLTLIAPAVAGGGPVVPGPLAGVGLPALIAAGGAVWLVRKLRQRTGR